MDKQKPFVTKTLDVELEDKSTVEKVSKTTTIKVVKVQSLQDSILKYTGSVTSKQYIWKHAGDIVEVSAEDAPYLLSIRFGGNSCCGGGSINGAIFQEIIDTL